MVVAHADNIFRPSRHSQAFHKATFHNPTIFHIVFFLVSALEMLKNNFVYFLNLAENSLGVTKFIYFKQKYVYCLIHFANNAYVFFCTFGRAN